MSSSAIELAIVLLNLYKDRDNLLSALYALLGLSDLVAFGILLTSYIDDLYNCRRILV